MKLQRSSNSRESCSEFCSSLISVSEILFSTRGANPDQRSPKYPLSHYHHSHHRHRFPQASLAEYFPLFVTSLAYT